MLYDKFMEEKLKTVHLEQLLKQIKHFDGYRAPVIENCQHENLPESNWEQEVFFPQNDQRKRISDLEYPVCCIGFIQIQRSDQKKGRGTGSLIGKNIVLTCAHNCFNKNTDQKYKLKFYPALNRVGDLQGADVADVKEFYYHQKWEKGEEDSKHYDLAILVISENFGLKYGYLGIDFSEQNIKQRQQFMMYGYSLFEDNQKSYLMHESPGVCKWVNQDEVAYGQSTRKGQSGGPLLIEKNGSFFIVAVHKGGEKISEQNHANHLTEQKVSEMYSWRNHFDQYDQQPKIIKKDLPSLVPKAQANFRI